MSTRTTRSSLKRGADSEETISTSKRSKSNSKKPASQPKTTSKGNNPSTSCDPNHPKQEHKIDNENEEPQIQSSTPTLTLPESTGDIFAAPPQTLLIHACNTEGSWGAGIAKAFKEHYPSAYKTYHDHCLRHRTKLHSTALLIPPSETDGPEHFIGCLFTSRSKGKKKDSPWKILQATGPAMRDFLGRVREWNEGKGEGERVGEVWMCKINSGLFGVKWEDTRGVLEGIEVGEGEVGEVKVVSREE